MLSNAFVFCSCWRERIVESRDIEASIALWSLSTNYIRIVAYNDMNGGHCQYCSWYRVTVNQLLLSRTWIHRIQRVSPRLTCIRWYKTRVMHFRENPADGSSSNYTPNASTRSLRPMFTLRTRLQSLHGDCHHGFKRFLLLPDADNSLRMPHSRVMPRSM
jgi:hypothetical protein